MKKLLKRREGQGLVEYILLVCLIALVVGVAILAFGEFLRGVFFHFIDVIAGWCYVCH